MVRMLSLTENLHTILRVLYDDMMALCYPMSQVAMAIAGIGALLYNINELYSTRMRTGNG